MNSALHFNISSPQSFNPDIYQCDPSSKLVLAIYPYPVTSVSHPWHGLLALQAAAQTAAGHGSIPKPEIERAWGKGLNAMGFIAKKP